MEKLLKNVQDIARLIKACKENGVREVEVEGLKLIFGGEEKPAEKWDVPFHEKPRETVVSAKTSGKAVELAQAAARKENDAAKNQITDEMLLNDPLGYEQALAEGDLEDDFESKEIGHSGAEPNLQ